jgi:hypothetical protein
VFFFVEQELSTEKDTINNTKKTDILIVLLKLEVFCDVAKAFKLFDLTLFWRNIASHKAGYLTPKRQKYFIFQQSGFELLVLSKILANHNKFGHFALITLPEKFRVNSNNIQNQRIDGKKT